MLRFVARLALRVLGWKLGAGPPDAPRYVVIAAPHTSNWDLLYMLLYAAAYGVRASWMMKHTMFRGPLGPLFKLLGGIPIDRRAPHGVVGTLARRFAERERMVLVVPPEGTRARTERWRSGFYRIAEAAGVPIALSYLDYGERAAGFGPAVIPSGNVKADMDTIRRFYRGVRPKHPGRFGPIQLLDEVVEPEHAEAVV